MQLMPQPFMAVPVTDRVYWVGALDWHIADFHGYRTERGTTYNAFLVLADKVTLIDTVKRPFLDEMLYRISSVIDPSKIEVIVSNHSEMDHSGSLIETAKAVNASKVYASANGVKALDAHFHHALDVEAVPNAGSVSLGTMTLQCFETKMIHWPDSMVSFLHEEKILFSQDAFGMHLATSNLFADENDRHVMQWEAGKYYANIVMPYSAIVATTLEALAGLKLPIATIAPDHGPIWRTPDDIAWILGLYAKFVAQKPTRKVVIVHDTMWGSTDLMARAVADGVRAAGVNVQEIPMHGAHRSNVATEVLDAGALIVGSPTMNSTIYPAMADVLTYLKGLKRKNLMGAVFGSFGWGANSIKELTDYMTAMGVELVAGPVKVNYVPTRDDLLQCSALGKAVAEELKKRC